MKVKNYKLIPANGWDYFSKHIELGDLLYDHLIPLVNQGSYEYLNLFVGCGVFEDDQDNSLFILFDDSRKKEKVVELRLSEAIKERPASESDLLTLVGIIIDKFQLIKKSID